MKEKKKGGLASPLQLSQIDSVTVTECRSPKISTLKIHLECSNKLKYLSYILYKHFQTLLYIWRYINNFKHFTRFTDTLDSLCNNSQYYTIISYQIERYNHVFILLQNLMLIYTKTSIFSKYVSRI